MKKLLAITTFTFVAATAALPSLALADMAYNVGVTTDYRYRGISQSRLQPALQGGADFTSGAFYLGTWASTIQWIKDGGGKANVEIDIYGGYKGEFAKDAGYDVGVLTYQYPSNGLKPSANTTEIYGALTLGQVTVKYSHAVSNLFGFAKSTGSGYLDTSLNLELAEGLTLTPHLGYQKVTGNSVASYTDYSLTLAKDFSGLVVSAALVGTSTNKVAGVPAYVSPKGKDLGRNAIVLGVKYNF
jgi:uncharacterized protein (TIGR02001 family)